MKSTATNRRTQILEVSARIFAEKGYQRATVKEIADRAGISPGTIYLYFDSKREILSVIAEETEIPIVSAILEMSEQGKRETLTRMIERGLDIAEAQLPFNRILFSEVWVEDGILEESVAARIERIHHLLEDYIAEGIESGVFRAVNPALAAQMALGMFAALTAPAVRGIVPLPSLEKRHSLAEAMVDLLLNGIRAQDRQDKKNEEEN